MGVNSYAAMAAPLLAEKGLRLLWCFSQWRGGGCGLFQSWTHSKAKSFQDISTYYMLRWCCKRLTNYEVSSVGLSRINHCCAVSRSSSFLMHQVVVSLWDWLTPRVASHAILSIFFPRVHPPVVLLITGLKWTGLDWTGLTKTLQIS